MKPCCLFVGTPSISIHYIITILQKSTGKSLKKIFKDYQEKAQNIQLQLQKSNAKIIEKILNYFQGKA